MKKSGVTRLHFVIILSPSRMLQKHAKLEVSFIESVKAKEEKPKSALPQMAT